MATKHENASLLDRGRAIVLDEIRGMEQLSESIDGAIEQAIGLIIQRTGRLVVAGIGKSGLIGAKLAATFASTGTPSFFLHAAEAAHGDLGMVETGDVVLAISNSGNSRELYPVIDYCTTNAIPLIAMCSREDSRLAKGATVLLKLPAVEEVCPNNLAPTTSAIVTLALGHVLAVLLMEAQSFGDSDFAEFHPGGRLGLMLQTVKRHIEDFDNEVPNVTADASVETVISELANGRKGCVVVTEGSQGKLCGLITEGDLRRAYSPDMFAKTAKDIMTVQPTLISPDELMRDAIQMMKTQRIANLVVVENDAAIAILHMKDLMQQGYL
jgi:arabinose-5-phosphate isomerase